jgi:hypothetical protein
LDMRPRLSRVISSLEYAQSILESTDPPVDRSQWLPGPWDSEPDRLEFRHAGFPCLLRRGGGGAWCGYVALPPGHAWYDLEASDIPASVNYKAPCDGDICHVPEPGEPDNVQWIGFDCGHARDIRPADMGLFRDMIPGAESLTDFASLCRAMEEYGLLLEGQQYRDVGYVRAKTERLAEEAKAAAG